jgi:hypothetical protein
MLRLGSVVINNVAIIGEALVVGLQIVHGHSDKYADLGIAVIVQLRNQQILRTRFHIRHCPVSFVCSPPVRRRVLKVTIRSGSATAEIGCPNRRLKYRLDMVSMPQRYRAAVRRFGSRRTGIVWPSVWRQQAEGAADRGEYRQAAGVVAKGRLMRASAVPTLCAWGYWTLWACAAMPRGEGDRKIPRPEK